MAHCDRFGPGLEFERVSKSRIDVDRRYQREANTTAGRKVIQRIVSEFTWLSFQAPLVARNGDRFNAIDGQHRVIAANRMPEIDLIPVLIAEGGSVEKEALAFLSINKNRVNVNVLSLYHAQLAAGVRWARIVADVCDEAQVVIPKGYKPSSSLAPNEVQCISTLRMNIRHQPELLAALMTITDAYPDENGMLASNYIKGLVHFYKTHGIREIDRDTLIKVLLEFDPFELEYQGRKMRETGLVKTTSTSAAMSAVLMEAYTAITAPKAGKK